MSGKLRVLFLVTDLALGGTPRSVESLVLGLDRSRFEPEVVTLLEPSPITDAISAAGIPCRALALRNKADVVRLAALVPLIAHGRFDIVHAWLFHANMLARLLSPLTRAKILTSERGIERMKSRFRVLVDRATAPLADRVLVNARAIADVLVAREGIDRAKIRVLENGVDLSRFRPQPVPPPPPKLICVARLDPIKAHEDLLEAMALLTARHPGLTLDLVGDGPQRAFLEERAAKLAISSVVRFLGARTDVPELLAQAHAFVLPSLSEGMPGSILEAMAMRLPVVATRVGGVPEIVVDGQTGVLVEPSSPRALASALEPILIDQARARTLGEAGGVRAREVFTREAFIKRHEELYLEVAGR